MVTRADIIRQRMGGGQGGARASNVVRIPAPSGGWNARDPYEKMKPEEAITLNNWIPGVLGVRIREGFNTYATGMTDPVETLMEYSPNTGAASEFYGAAGTSIFDISTTGAVGAAEVTGLTNAVFQHTMHVNSAIAALVAVNGEDDPQMYDGSSWTEPAITGSGLTPSDFIHVASHKRRLWFVEKSTLNAWYMPTEAVAGMATKFPLAALCKLGGELMAIGTWTRDGGDGADDMWVGVTSQGEVLVYQGTDPASASTWSLVGVFRITPPMGRRCFIRAGADLGVLTYDGPISLTQVLPFPGSTQKSQTLTDKVKAAFDEARQIAAFGSAWSIIEVPQEQFILMIAPSATDEQSNCFVMSADTGGWCLFPRIDGVCAGLFRDDLYIGLPDGTVKKYGDSYDDDGVPITATLQTAFTTVKGIEEKRFVMARPLMQGPQGYTPIFGLRTDYDVSPISPPVSPAISIGGAVWDEEDWDVASWGQDTVTIAKWQSVSGIGSTVSLVFSITTDMAVSIQSVDLMYEQGGPL